MRAIKFRAWDKFNNKMAVEGENVEHLIHLIWDEKESGFSLREWDDIVYMQYTGLKDKNGKEIYEGDCMVMDGDRDVVFEVFYHDGKGAFDCARVHYHNARCGTYVPNLNSNRLEIIGNIYETPELLS